MRTPDHFSADKFTEELRLPRVWPGMYDKHFVMVDGEAMCFECATKEKERILREIAEPCDPQWLPIGVDVNWECNVLMCSHCAKQIPPEYGDNKPKETL